MSSKVEVSGTVQVWHSEEGWGVLVSPEMKARSLLTSPPWTPLGSAIFSLASEFCSAT